MTARAARIAIVTVSDRASRGEYEDKGGPGAELWLREVPTAILSRQTAAIRGATLIITIPGKPSAIATCLDAVFAAVPYCLDLMGAARIETDPARIKAFRPKGA
ncbi:MAG: hypothetical protein ACK4M5_17790 [Dietzia cercidiphylli]